MIWPGWENNDYYFFSSIFCLLLLQSAGVIFSYDLLKTKSRIIAKAFMLIILLLMIFFSYKISVRYYNSYSIDRYVLLTRVPSMIESDIDDKCYVITNNEDAVTLTGGSLLKVMVISNIKYSIKTVSRKAGCLLYFDGLICTRSLVEKGQSNKCTEIYKYFNLNQYKSYNYKGFEFTLYQLTLKS